MLVYFLRHASAGQNKKNSELDARRPLDENGIEQCKVVGRALAATGVEVDEIISSPLTRAAQTATRVAHQIGFSREIRHNPVLATEGDLAQFRALLKSYADRDAIMVVGHNPSLSRFLSLLLSGGSNDSMLELKKGAIAKVEFDARRRASLYWCITPKLVGALQEGATRSSRPKTSRK